MRRKILYALAIGLFPFILYSQVGGTYAYSVLNLKNNARSAGLGFDFLSVSDADISLVVSNPSLISPDIHNALSLNVINQFDGINYGSVNYARTFNRIGSFSLALQYINYGTFDRYNEADVAEGQFTASDYVVVLGWARKLDSNFTIAANLKPVFSFYDSYFASAIVVDLAVNYNNSKHQINATLMAKNIGYQFISFNNTNEKLPFELAFGFSKKLAKAPFRIYFNATHLNKWNLRYEDPLNPTSKTDPFTSEVIGENKFKGFADNLFRHALFGVEFCPSKAFMLRVGYSYKQVREMQTPELFSLSGLSYGMGIKIKQFSINYSRNNYHFGSAPNFITVSAHLGQFIK